jgi:hypothetical protein
LISYAVAVVFVSFGLVIVVMQTRLALAVYLVVFGWIIVAAFKMGMIFQNAPVVSSNTKLNLAVVNGSGMGTTPTGRVEEVPEKVRGEPPLESSTK